MSTVVVRTVVRRSPNCRFERIRCEHSSRRRPGLVAGLLQGTACHVRKGIPLVHPAARGILFAPTGAASEEYHRAIAELRHHA